MKQDMQENNDGGTVVLYNTQDRPCNVYDFIVNSYVDTTVGNHIKGDNTDYEEMNKIIYL